MDWSTKSCCSASPPKSLHEREKQVKEAQKWNQDVWGGKALFSILRHLKPSFFHFLISHPCDHHHHHSLPLPLPLSSCLFVVEGTSLILFLQKKQMRVPPPGPNVDDEMFCFFYLLFIKRSSIVITEKGNTFCIFHPKSNGSVSINMVDFAFGHSFSCQAETIANDRT